MPDTIVDTIVLIQCQIQPFCFNARYSRLLQYQIQSFYFNTRYNRFASMPDTIFCSLSIHPIHPIANRSLWDCRQLVVAQLEQPCIVVGSDVSSLRSRPAGSCVFANRSHGHGRFMAASFKWSLA